MQHVYNLVRQEPDARDYKRPRLAVEKLPPIIDLRPKCSPVYDQGVLGACTGNAGAEAAKLVMNLRFDPSRLYLYYTVRLIEGTVELDCGAQMRDVCDALHKYGICSESCWPYDVTKFAKKPTKKACTAAAKHKITEYATFDGDTVNDIQQIRAYLAKKSLPVLIGMDVYSSFESDEVARTGIVPMPDTSTEQLLGGHAVLIVGYDDTRKVLIVRNSWGDGWGDKGYFYLPYDYVENKLAYDTWTIVA
ncbi:Cysteine protease, C1A family [Sporobacter termitidis DSM 10068]|uniref:Cysteine protease, C1A family n=1 Tax=Sporobacter termitidis DSM 10068 TaxID=1123282 RepID=A0A1M5YSW5_9FIRM|nr:C1 family peptidase [Sporobacter termitidis]SHI15095.1 Cysteine protease, C1A family [Sporobacter termitidis DSM 10068]